MIFLIPLLIIVAVIFGIDYLYFSEENQNTKEKIIKKEENLSLDLQRQEHLKELFKKQ